MAIPVAMPRLGMTMREGAVREWSVGLGTRVEKGQTLVVIESEKAEVEVEATASGWLRHVYVPVDETVPCGTLLAALTESEDEPFDADAFAREQPAPEEPAAVAPPAATAPVAPQRGTRRTRPVAPAARALARRLGVEVDAVQGTGPGGRLTREDVEGFAARRAGLTPASDGVALEVLRDGTGEPVVLLPGFGMDPSSFAFQTPALAQRFGVVAVSPRGVGLSDAPELPAYPVETAARDVAALLEAPAHVVGASLGAAVALELALLAPGKVRSLALVTPFVTASARLLAVTDAWCRVAAEAGAETLARTLLPWLFSERFLADAPLRERTLRGLAASVAHVSAPTLARTAEGLRAWSGTRGDDLGRIACPTLVLAGGADLLTPDAEALADRIPGARCVTVPGAGHALAVEAADAVNDALRDHLGARAAG